MKTLEVFEINKANFFVFAFGNEGIEAIFPLVRGEERGRFFYPYGWDLRKRFNSQRNIKEIILISFLEEKKVIDLLNKIEGVEKLLDFLEENKEIKFFDKKGF